MLLTSSVVSRLSNNYSCIKDYIKVPHILNKNMEKEKKEKKEKKKKDDQQKVIVLQRPCQP